MTAEGQRLTAVDVADDEVDGDGDAVVAGVVVVVVGAVLGVGGSAPVDAAQEHHTANDNNNTSQCNTRPTWLPKGYFPITLYHTRP